MTTQEIQAYIVQIAQQYRVDPALALAVAQHESSFNPNATGAAGDAGIFQLIPSTAADLGVTNSYDPTQNIQGGVLYLAQLLQQYDGNVTTALEAYNGGQGNVNRGTISTAAQAYPVDVLSLLPDAQTILANLGVSTSPNPPKGPASRLPRRIPSTPPMPGSLSTSAEEAD
jgi:soluble lytic murein transglycosylase-like protein